MAIHWQEWCPNNGLGMIIVLVTYAGAIIVTGYGIYLISPIYIGKAWCILEEKLVVVDDDDEDAYDENFREFVIWLRNIFLW